MPPSVIVTAGPVRVVRLAPGPVQVVRVAPPQPVKVLSVAQQGRPGAKGDPGERGLPGSVAGTLPYSSITGAPALAYLYPQATPSAFWDITHALGYYPAVTVMDSAGSVVQGDIQHFSANRLTLTFSAAFSGQASLT